MITRRSFVKSTAVFSAVSVFNSSYFFTPSSLIGLQLYTVRDAMRKDPAATLEKIAQIGYQSVESVGYTSDEKFYKMDPLAFSKVLKQNGLVMPSAHYRFGIERNEGEIVNGTILHDWQRAIDDAAVVGLKYMVLGGLAMVERGGIDRYKYIADELNIAGENCKKAGIQLCYHNHDFEFEKQSGTTPYDILLGTDENLVKMEIDLYWVTKANQDPITLMEDHPGRFPLWHVKDMERSVEQKFTEVGNGTINFKQIFRHAKKAGLQYFFVEQDKTNGSPFDSITQSISFIKKHIL